MSKQMLQVAVYPLLLINLALGFVMFSLSHHAILIVAGMLNRGGLLADETLGPYFYVQQSISIVGVILLAILALIFFPILQSYYAKDLQSWRQLFRKFLFAFGIQLAYIGFLQLCIRLMVGETMSAGMEIGLALVQLLAGIGMTMWARNDRWHDSPAAAQ